MTTGTEPLKSCACGASYSEAEWAALPLVGVQLDDADAPLEAQELRNCPRCASTLYVSIVSHPDDIVPEESESRDRQRASALRLSIELRRALGETKELRRRIAFPATVPTSVFGADQPAPTGRGFDQGGEAGRKLSETRGADQTAWRRGQKLGRTLYFNDRCVGMVDTPGLAILLVDAANREATARTSDSDVEYTPRSAEAHRAVAEGRTCAHDFRTIESDDQAGQQLVHCRACGLEQMHVLRRESDQRSVAANSQWIGQIATAAKNYVGFRSEANWQALRDAVTKGGGQ